LPLNNQEIAERGRQRVLLLISRFHGLNCLKICVEGTREKRLPEGTEVASRDSIEWKVDTPNVKWLLDVVSGIRFGEIIISGY
jgi:hypothetical protein